MKVITAEWLERDLFPSPCRNQMRKFKKLFPNGAELTLRNIQLCADNNLDLPWFAGCSSLLSCNARDYLKKKTDKFWLEPAMKGFYGGPNRMRSKRFRKLIQHYVRPLWNAIKLDRKLK